MAIPDREPLALVTGAGGAIGSAVATALREAGMAVLATDLGGREGCHAHDVTSEEDWRDLADRIERESGALDVLVNNAGTASPPLSSKPSTLSGAEIDRLMAVNFKGSVLGCTAMLPLLAKSGRGAIINNASLAALVATPFDTAYGASKAAITQYTKSLALEAARLTPYPVRCNSIHPGIIRSPMTDAFFRAIGDVEQTDEAAAREAMRKRIPLGTIGEPAQVASVVAFLASEASGYVTGQSLVIDGGMTLE